MDPIANLASQRACVAEINAINARWRATSELSPADLARLAELAEQLAELVEALDTWRANGGFDPYTTTCVASLVRSCTEGMPAHLMRQLLDSVMHYIGQDVRVKVMHEVPAAYNAFNGREIVSTHVAAPPPRPSTTN
jgi:hypothetical protein